MHVVVFLEIVLHIGKRVYLYELTELLSVGPQDIKNLIDWSD